MKILVATEKPFAAVAVEGIRKEIESLVTRKLYIPAYPTERGNSESLNVAIATAIVCAEFRRQAAWQ